MFKIPYEDIISTIKEKANLSEDDIDLKVKAKLQSLSCPEPENCRDALLSISFSLRIGICPSQVITIWVWLPLA